MNFRKIIYAWPQKIKTFPSRKKFHISINFSAYGGELSREAYIRKGGAVGGEFKFKLNIFLWISLSLMSEKSLDMCWKHVSAKSRPHFAESNWERLKMKIETFFPLGLHVRLSFFPTKKRNGIWTQNESTHTHTRRVLLKNLIKRSFEKESLEAARGNSSNASLIKLSSFVSVLACGFRRNNPQCY